MLAGSQAGEFVYSRDADEGEFRRSHKPVLTLLPQHLVFRGG